MELKELMQQQEERMNKSIESLKHEFASIRTGRASTALLDKVMVDYYGSPTPINQVANISVPKPEAVLEKMVNGRIEKFYKENCLLEQAFIKDGDKTVTDIINENIAKIGENINVRRFVRYGLGEGIEKRQDDFVAEVMASVGK